MICICLSWRGIVSVFLWQLVSAWQRGDHQWGSALFLAPDTAAALVPRLPQLWATHRGDLRGCLGELYDELARGWVTRPARS